MNRLHSPSPAAERVSAPPVRDPGELGAQQTYGNAFLASQLSGGEEDGGSSLDGLADFGSRLTQFWADVHFSAGRVGEFLGPALERRVDPLIAAALHGFLEGMLFELAFVAASTAAGALVGSLAGGVGAVPGAAIGFRIGTMVAEGLDLAELVPFLVEGLASAGAGLARYVERCWDAQGDEAKVAEAAGILAEALADFAVVVLVAVLEWAAEVGSRRAFEALRDTDLGRALGDEGLAKWLGQRAPDGSPSPDAPPQDWLAWYEGQLASDLARQRFDEVVEAAGDPAEAVDVLHQLSTSTEGGGLQGALTARPAEGPARAPGDAPSPDFDEAVRLWWDLVELWRRAEQCGLPGWEGWVRWLREEKKRLDATLNGATPPDEGTNRSVRSNLDGVRGEIDEALKDGASAVNHKIKYGGGKELEIDVVGVEGGQLVWREVKNVGLFGKGSSTWTSIEKKAHAMLAAAAEFSLDNGPIALVFTFPRGVTREIADALIAMGFRVEGPIVDP